MTAYNDAKAAAQRARAAPTTDQKLDEMARAIEALAKAIADLSYDLGRVESGLSRLR